MSEHEPRSNDADDEEPHSRRGALIAFAVVLVLLIGGYLLTNLLHGVGQIQDCAMAGRSNCAPIRN